MSADHVTGIFFDRRPFVGERYNTRPILPDQDAPGRVLRVLRVLEDETGRFIDEETGDVFAAQVLLPLEPLRGNDEFCD